MHTAHDFVYVYIYKYKTKGYMCKGEGIIDLSRVLYVTVYNYVKVFSTMWTFFTEKEFLFRKL